MQCLPDSLRDRVYYRPTNEGIEKRIRERLEEIPESRPVLFQNTEVHHHKDSGLARLLRRAFVDHAFLQPDRGDLQLDRLLHDLIHILRPPEHIHQIDLLQALRAAFRAATDTTSPRAPPQYADSRE
jgi:hypothetical protein